MSIFVSGNNVERIYVNNTPVPEVYLNGKLIFPSQLMYSATTSLIEMPYGGGFITAKLYTDSEMTTIGCTGGPVSQFVSGSFHKLVISAHETRLNSLKNFPPSIYSLYVTNTGTYPVWMFFYDVAPYSLRIISVSGPFILWVAKDIPYCATFRNNVYDSCKSFNLYVETGTRTSNGVEGYYYRWN